MNIYLTPELEKLVQSKIQSGRYNSASEVVGEALMLLEQRDDVYPLRNEEVRKQIEEGRQSAKRGEFVDGDEVFDRIDAELAAMERSAANEAFRSDQAGGTRFRPNQEISRLRRRAL